MARTPGPDPRSPRDDRPDPTGPAGAPPRPRARVVVLAGPSGAGKSRLAGRLAAAHGWPVVRLDDFYRDGDDPSLPVVDLGGGTRLVDWDDPASWDGDAAVAALAELVDRGRAQVPAYDIATSRRVGGGTVDLAPGALVLAEGIFAAEAIAPLRAHGLLHSAWCVRRHPSVTFLLRLARDLRERRKPPLVLLKRGWALRRAEPGVVARMEALGATCATPSETARHLSASHGADRR
ncbi:uridine kinase family protein [Lapillicoccus jejuensis]|uniref:Uridine kinase n=1 Tax=Lapillicoccus jejuensis TaxID=402171 RepID=A0A542E258_9MICO|nr:ATP-binding protein [Lapillicoccus jejuensis]TQJ09441.1 uridine kinase [Lapillicoccus jejuensis]